jgi:hypothetical protein
MKQLQEKKTNYEVKQNVFIYIEHLKILLFFIEK